MTNVDLTPDQQFLAEKEARALHALKGDERLNQIRMLVNHCIAADEVIEGLQEHAIHADAVILELLNQLEEIGVCIAEAKADDDDDEFLKEDYLFDIDDYFANH